MKKVVINTCFGGFSLSPLAVKRMAELKGKKCYFFEDSFSGSERITKKVPIEKLSGIFWSAYTIPNPDEVLDDEKHWHDMSKKEKAEHNKKYNEISLDTRPSDREDFLLIQVVEELGKRANGRCANLKIVKIPNDAEYEISEYDGNEHIAEKHRKWR